MRRALSLSIAVCVFLLGACREPRSVEQFIPGEGPFDFSFSMTDSTATYDFDLFTRIDASPEDLAALGSLPLAVTWTSPSGQRFTENVFFPLQGKSSFFSRQVYQPYRAGVSPYEYGEWNVSVFIPVSARVPGMRGMGLVVTKN